MIRVVIADDHMLFREGLRRVIEDWDEFQVVGEASDGAEAVIRSKALRPDIVLMDADMPGMSGVEAVRRISEDEPEIKCVMLTVAEDADVLRDSIAAGASGYILKDMPMRRLRSMLKALMDGEAPISGKMAAKAIESMRRPMVLDETESKQVDSLKGLTQREKDVLRLIADGASNQEIAERLSLSETTVKKHLNNVFVKIGVSNRVQAAVYAIRSGLL